MTESEQVPKNRLFAFANYLGAYSHGAWFLENKLKQLTLEIEQTEGIKMPKIVYVDLNKY